MRRWIVRIIGLVMLALVAPAAESQSKGEGASPGNANPGNSNPGADPAAGKAGPIPRTGSDANQPSPEDTDSSTKKKKRKVTNQPKASGRTAPRLARPNRDSPKERRGS
jgi:hypothetical protein